MQKKTYARNVLGFMELLEDAGYLVTSRLGTRRQIMARKFSKAQQVKGLRKALKNPRTPKAFLPSMRKRLAKLES
jgi:hypothetical protein